MRRSTMSKPRVLAPDSDGDEDTDDFSSAPELTTAQSTMSALSAGTTTHLLSGQPVFLWRKYGSVGECSGQQRKNSNSTPTLPLLFTKSDTLSAQYGTQVVKVAGAISPMPKRWRSGEATYATATPSASPASQAAASRTQAQTAASLPLSDEQPATSSLSRGEWMAISLLCGEDAEEAMAAAPRRRLAAMRAFTFDEVYGHDEDSNSNSNSCVSGDSSATEPAAAVLHKPDGAAPPKKKRQRCETTTRRRVAAAPKLASVVPLDEYFFANADSDLRPQQPMLSSTVIERQNHRTEALGTIH